MKTDRHRHADTWTDRQTDFPKNREQAGDVEEIETEDKHRDRLTNTNRRTHRLSNGQTERRKHRQTETSPKTEDEPETQNLMRRVRLKANTETDLQTQTDTHTQTVKRIDRQTNI